MEETTTEVRITTRRCRRGGQFVRVWMIDGHEYDFITAQALLVEAHGLSTAQANRVLFRDVPR
jgi:hypothetical protein